MNDDLGYRLHESVQHTTRLLASQPEADFHFCDGHVDISATVRHAEFNSWIAPDLAAIDRAFLSGGTSFVPAVRELITTRFGPEKIQSGDEFTSIAQGLALQAESA